MAPENNCPRVLPISRLSLYRHSSHDLAWLHWHHLWTSSSLTATVTAESWFIVQRWVIRGKSSAWVEGYWQQPLCKTLYRFQQSLLGVNLASLQKGSQFNTTALVRGEPSCNRKKTVLYHTMKYYVKIYIVYYAYHGNTIREEGKSPRLRKSIIFFSQSIVIQPKLRETLHQVGNSFN